MTYDGWKLRESPLDDDPPEPERCPACGAEDEHDGACAGCARCDRTVQWRAEMEHGAMQRLEDAIARMSDDGVAPF